MGQTMDFYITTAFQWNHAMNFQAAFCPGFNPFHGYPFDLDVHLATWQLKSFPPQSHITIHFHYRVAFISFVSVVFCECVLYVILILNMHFVFVTLPTCSSINYGKSIIICL